MILAPLYLSSAPSPGALLGTTGTQELVQQINNNLGMASNFFGSVDDIFAKGRQAFIQNIVEPIRQVGNTIKGVTNKLLKNDVIMPLIEENDYAYVPPAMHMPILLYEPMRNLHDQGRIYGFGYDPANMPTEDVYGRLINNGTVDLAKDMESDGTITFIHEWDTDDPDLSHEELSYIEQTRRYLDEIIEQRKFDPTDYPNMLS